MLSLKSGFNFRNRGFKHTLVLIPGWATDYRIFTGLKLDYNYLLATGLCQFNQALLNQLDRLKIGKVSIFGFSLGGFLGAEFAANFPERITELILLGVRKRYQPKILQDIKYEIQKNSRTWLYKFYLNCFSRADTQGLSWFKKNLLKEYTDNLNLNELIWGLDYLSSHAITSGSLSKIEQIRIFHGSEDLIAPISEALKIKSDLPQAKFVCLAGAGHFSFLNPAFRERFYDA